MPSNVNGSPIYAACSGQRKSVQNVRVRVIIAAIAPESGPNRHWLPVNIPCRTCAAQQFRLSPAFGYHPRQMSGVKPRSLRSSASEKAKLLNRNDRRINMFREPLALRWLSTDAQAGMKGRRAKPLRARAAARSTRRRYQSKENRVSPGYCKSALPTGRKGRWCEQASTRSPTRASQSQPRGQAVCPRRKCRPRRAAGR
jgi:hypothetical protein